MTSEQFGILLNQPRRPPPLRPVSGQQADVMFYKQSRNALISKQSEEPIESNVPSQDSPESIPNSVVFNYWLGPFLRTVYRLEHSVHSWVRDWLESVNPEPFNWHKELRLWKSIRGWWTLLMFLMVYYLVSDTYEARQMLRSVLFWMSLSLFMILRHLLLYLLR